MKIHSQSGIIFQSTCWGLGHGSNLTLRECMWHPTIQAHLIYFPTSRTLLRSPPLFAPPTLFYIAKKFANPLDDFQISKFLLSQGKIWLHCSDIVDQEVIEQVKCQSSTSTSGDQWLCTIAMQKPI